jgi:hypothetical protein
VKAQFQDGKPEDVGAVITSSGSEDLFLAVWVDRIALYQDDMTMGWFSPDGKVGARHPDKNGFKVGFAKEKR